MMAYGRTSGRHIALRFMLLAAAAVTLTAAGAATGVLRVTPAATTSQEAEAGASSSPAALAGGAGESSAAIPAIDSGADVLGGSGDAAAAAFAFPVAGHDLASVVSRFGDARDGGRRIHLGVDIAALTGTPVVAPEAGTVDRVENSRTGGLAVWLRADAAERRYYFAHLHTIAVTRGQRLTAGDTIGTVGQTGNAAGTVPHLHLAVHEGPHVLDPWWFLVAALRPPVARDPGEAAVGMRMRTRVDGAAIRSAPGAGRVLAVLPRNADVTVLDRVGDYLRVRADRAEGYVAEWVLQPE
jgi:murein DD-endopeptidase MepM/ murein hydrolase activator NlpD